jgi:hypothetical protein
MAGLLRGLRRGELSGLTSVLAKIATTRLSELEQFLPDVWKADAASEPEPDPAPGS